MQVSHYGAYAGWAALELYVAEQLCGARLAHCFGNLIQEPSTRAVVQFALDDLRERRSVGSMIYGNTVDYLPRNDHRNIAVLAGQMMGDIGAQLRRPTGHAINPVPLTENERIPSADEIVEVQLLAREMEREVRRSAPLFDWERLETLGAEVATYAREFRDRALVKLAESGVDVADPAEVLIALRRTGAAEIERQVDLVPSDDVARLVPWKSKRVRSLASELAESMPSLDGMKVVLAVLEVHDLAVDALARALPAAGAEVVLLDSRSTPAGIVNAAVDEDAEAVVLAVYNGNALHLGRLLRNAADSADFSGAIFMGGVLNQDEGDGLPVDARPGLAALGITCIDRIETLGPALAASRS
jgi:methylmalonyl-CoA mutase cobalamin-binding subunit